MTVGTSNLREIPPEPERTLTSAPETEQHKAVQLGLTTMDIVVVDEHYEPIVSLIDHVPSDHEYLKSPNSCTSDPLEVEERPSSICVDLNEEVQISKHGHLTDETKFST